MNGFGNQFENTVEAIKRAKQTVSAEKEAANALRSGEKVAEGAAEGNTRLSEVKGARYGEQKISKSLYDKLRIKTPSDEIQDMVNENIILPMDDPALPGMKIELKEGQNMH